MWCSFREISSKRAGISIKMYPPDDSVVSEQKVHELATVGRDETRVGVKFFLFGFTLSALRYRSFVAGMSEITVGGTAWTIAWKTEKCCNFP